MRFSSRAAAVLLLVAIPGMARESAKIESFLIHPANVAALSATRPAPFAVAAGELLGGAGVVRALESGGQTALYSYHRFGWPRQAALVDAAKGEAAVSAIPASLGRLLADPEVDDATKHARLLGFFDGVVAARGDLPLVGAEKPSRRGRAGSVLVRSKSGKYFYTDFPILTHFTRTYREDERAFFGVSGRMRQVKILGRRSRSDGTFWLKTEAGVLFIPGESLKDDRKASWDDEDVEDLSGRMGELVPRLGIYRED